MAPPNGKGTLISGSRTMRIINHSFAVDRYFDLISTATSRVLIIDYGGLAPPSDHGPCLPIPAVPGLLEQIRSRTGTRLVLISDRDCKTVRSLLGLHPPPEIWAVGGLERAWPDGSYELAPFDERALRGLAEADDWSQAAGLLPWTEQKPGGIALLERTSEATDWNSLRARAWTAWAEIAAEYGLSILNLEHGIELRVPSRTRVEAIKTVLAETDSSIPIAYLGDGILSEFAFDALGARGAKVLVREKARPTLADVWITHPRGVVDFLQTWLHACHPERWHSDCA